MLKIKKEYLGKEVVFHLPKGISISADDASQSDLKKVKAQKGNEKFFVGFYNGFQAIICILIGLLLILGKVLL